MPNLSEASTEPESRASWLSSGRFALFLGLLIAATFPAVLAGARTFVIRDYGMFGYPLACFHRESFWRGELPLWNPLNHCGLPFLAQWNTLTLYPLSLIYLLFPLTWSLPFFCLIHLFWGGLGMYFWAKRWTNHQLAAALAGIVYAFSGLSLNALMWPNIEATLGWLPWVIWLAQKGWREGGRALVLAVAAGAMQMLAGGPETTIATWGILFLLACGDWASTPVLRKKIPIRFSGLVVVVALVCAAQLLPFLELLAHSERDTNVEVSSWPMPLLGWANFLVPLFRTGSGGQGVFFQKDQQWTSSYYLGILTVWLIFVAVRRVRDWRVYVMAGCLFFALVLALGDDGLLYRGLRYVFPPVRFFRFPIKFVLIVTALAPMLAAYGIKAFLTQTKLGRFEKICAAIILFLTGMIVFWDRKFPIPEDVWHASFQNGLVRAAFFAFCLGGLVMLRRSPASRRMLFSFLFLIVLALDLVTQVPTQNPTVRTFVYEPGWTRRVLKWEKDPELGNSRAMLGADAWAELRHRMLPDLEKNFLIGRMAVLGDCNLLDNVPQVYGFYSMTPRNVKEVTTLPYVQPNIDLRGLLDFLGVSQETIPGTTCDWRMRPTAMPMVTAGQRAVFASDYDTFQAFGNTNVEFRRIVFLPPEASTEITATQHTAARVLSSRFSNQTISIATEASAESMLVIAQSYYPAWKAYLDGRPIKIFRANFAFQAVEVPKGSHEVRLRYEDQKLFLGLWISAVGLAACLILWFSSRPIPAPVASSGK